jgi:small-conductance mechanosensitive channel
MAGVARRTRLIGIVVAASLLPCVTAQTTGGDVIEHLNHVIAWYRTTEQLCQSIPALGAAPSRDGLRQESVAVIQRAFDYAQAEAAVATPVETGKEASASGSSQRNVQNAYDAAAQKINEIRTQISALDGEIAKTRGKKQAALVSERDVLNAELQINQNLQDSLKKLLDYMSATGEGGSATGLVGKINDLLQTVPQARATNQGKAPPSPAPTNNSNNPQTFHADSAGILSLGIEIFTLMRGRVQLDEQASSTTTLLDEVRKLRTPMGARLRSLLARTQQLSAQPETSDPDARQKLRQELRQLEHSFSQTSNIIVPLSKEAFQLEAARENLGQWSSEIQREYLTALRYLLLRFGEIGIVIVFILVLSEIWRRLTFRYVRDARLRRQVLLFRRIAMGFAISLTVVLSFVTEFGSFATFAGFITAGIAVALQNLILSVVAYFFLIGRYGARVGDRLTISGVTGEVIEVGLVRLYMMELSGAGSDLRPTGRIVVFSNSVLFQPSAFFKQLPGTDYGWHTVTLTLASDADLDAAESRLMAAVSGVYGRYKDSIARQHAAFERSVNLQVSEPAPERYVKYTDQGLEFSVRYPVETRRAAGIDEQIMKALLDTINREPKIHFAGGPRIQATA